jgi:hypothetical protein
MNDLLAMLLSWVPVLALIGALVWFWRNNGMRALSRSRVAMIELYEQQVAETRRMNVTLERIASSLEKRRQQK